MPKRRRKRSTGREPNNLTFWVFVLKNPEETQQFLKRGDRRQKLEIIESLEYLRGRDVNGLEELDIDKLIKAFKKELK